MSLPTAHGLYKALIKAGILYWDEVESFEGVRVLRFEVSEEPYYGTRDDWFAQYCGDKQWAIFNKVYSLEWTDEQGDYRSGVQVHEILPELALTEEEVT